MSNLVREESRSFQPNLTDDDDCDDDIADHNESVVMSNAEKAYLESNNSKKHLFLMCFGLAEGGTPVFDLDAEPWHSIKKREIKPARMEYAEEICRRSKCMSSSIDRVHHKPANWSLTKCIDWLQEHPVVDPQDVLFLKNEVSRVKDVILNAQQEQQEEEARQAAGQWRGRIPYMRLFLCLIQDDIKSAFLRRADTRTRHELDARNSVVRPPTAFELISDRWNDEGFNPVAPISECHEDFATPTNCAHSEVTALMRATPQKVEDVLASIRSNLLRIIQNWERSGQGEGGRHAGDDEELEDPEDYIIFDTSSIRFGSLTTRSECALQNRAAFLNGKPSYLLYFWELADRHQLLQSSLQRLDHNVCASDASSAPSATSSHATNGTRRRQRQDEHQQPESSRDIFALSESIRFLAKAEDDRQVRRRIADLQDQARTFRRMYAESDDLHSARAQFYQNEVQQIAEEIAALEQPMITTPVSRNGTPRTPRTP